MTAVADTEVEKWTSSDLKRYVGGLSNPSKMPGYGYSLPAEECVTGSKLRPLEGTVCHDCYALKGRYKFPVVRSALYRRLEAIRKPLWPRVMAELINRLGHGYFRWHDSGDLQSVDHLRHIVAVCNLTPAVRHWLPTREYRIVQEFDGVIPANLTIRVSAHRVDGPPPKIPGTVSSTVSSGQSGRPDSAHICPAPDQGNHCGSCRACWDPEVKVVDYRLH